MVGPSTRADASLIDSVSEQGPNELDLTMANERGRTNEVIRLGEKQWRSIEASRDNGEKLISGGRALQGARTVSPWLKKCG
jgi:hypothetical protein